MSSSKSTRKEPHISPLDKEDKHFRRATDIERLARLEYVVYEDHDPLLLQHSDEIAEIAKNFGELTRHLKTIRNMVGAFLIGAVATQIGWEKALKLLMLLGA